MKKKKKIFAKTLRDPGGNLFSVDGRLIRFVKKSYVEDVSAFLASKAARVLAENGDLVRTRVVNEEEVQEIWKRNELGTVIDARSVGMVMEHERAPFVSFPYEWPPEMLAEAARLTLTISELCAKEGLGLKDATPYNVLFWGSKAVFVDMLSFGKRDVRDATWLPYAEFTRTFILPLLLCKIRNVDPAMIFLKYRDGIEHKIAYDIFGPVRGLSPLICGLVTIPKLLGGLIKEKNALYKKRTTKTEEEARFILLSIFGHLRRALQKSAPRENKKSVWRDYSSRGHYSETARGAKWEFVKKTLNTFPAKRVLDIGCNTGNFSALAAESGAEVIAIDSDKAVVGEVWKRAIARHLNILPLVVDITRPSPAIGWRNSECESFLERAKGACDMVFMLAIVHHILVTERIPLSEIIKLAAELTSRYCIVEFVATDDPMFQTIARGKVHAFSSYTREHFEEECDKRFSCIRTEKLSPTRWIYCLQKRRTNI